jgi:predicted Zn-dependent peptidase
MRRIAAGVVLLAALSAPAAYGQREAFRRNPPPAEPYFELRLPEIQWEVLNNGLDLSLVPRENAGMSSLQLLFFAGEGFSPAAQPGLASAAAQMFARGTRLLSSADIEDRLADVGGSFSARIHPDYALFTFRFLSEFMDPALDLLGQLILQPSWSESELNDVKVTQAMAFIEQDRDPESVAPRHFVRVIFQGHPYQNSSFSRDMVRNWTLRDMNAFADALYRPNNAHLTVGGDLNMNTAVKKISHLLSVWPARDLPPSPLRAVRPPERERICLIDVPKTRDCMITMGTVFEPPALADRMALAVLGQVLGGTPASRLFMNLRESKNYAYFASCETEFLRATGLLTVRAKVKPDSVVASIREIQRELLACAREPLPSEDIEQAKAYLINHFPLELESFDMLTERAVLNRAYDEGDDLWNQAYRQISLVNADRVFEVAARVLVRPFVIVVAGDKNILSPSMNEFDAVEVYDNLGRLQYTTARDKKGAQNEAR